MKKLLAVSFFGFAAIFNSFSAPTNQPPASAEQLRSEFEAALKAKDTNALASLYDWQGVSDDLKEALHKDNMDMMKEKITSVTLAPLESNYPIETESESSDGLVFFDSNIPIIGNIAVTSGLPESPDGETTASFPYGETHNVFYFFGTVMRKIPLRELKERELKIIVICPSEPFTYTGSCVYVKDGKKMTMDISGSGSRTNSYRGAYVKSCTVQKTSGKGQINLKIYEDDKAISRIGYDNGTGVVILEGNTDPKEPISYEILKYEDILKMFEP
jgi:hypothetical protein